MNRRNFLKAIGAIAIVVQAPVAAARKLVHPTTWRERLPIPTTLEELAPAIERLFIGGVRDLESVYDRDGQAGVAGFGLASAKREGEAIQYDLGQYVHRTFALAYCVQEDQEYNDRLERAMIQCHYLSMLQLSRRHENLGATLIWRKKPMVMMYHADPLEPFVSSFSSEVVHRSIRMRLSLKQNGWRERLMVEPVYDVPGLKAEGAIVKEIA